MKKFIFIFLLIANFVVFGQSQDAVVQIELKKPNPHRINKNVHGGFVEMLRDFVNGPLGIWAQDFMDRGFDCISPSLETSQYWDKFKESNETTSTWTLKDGGYNQNGRMYQELKSSSDEGLIGISQMTYVSDNTSSSFYVWAKSDNVIELKLKLINPLNDQVLLEENLGLIKKNWGKLSANIPAYKGVHKYQVVIYFEGEGTAYIDEASLMPDNNIDGVRKEYYDLFELWSPSVIRYPGGGFADSKANVWYGGVGDIDQRLTPIFHGLGFNVQRLDWGTDEYLKFCRNLDIEPHIVVNLARKTAQEAADWVEYCNGNINTKYGELRSDNGHPEPYNVVLWEIGNEQWYDEIDMSNDYLTYYNAMKAVDPNIELMVDGNIWAGINDNFDKIMGVVKEKCQTFGWHWAQIGKPKVPAHNDTIYYNMLAGSSDISFVIGEYDKKVFESDYSAHLRHGSTEWWLIYVHGGDWLDTAARGASLECGLANACCLQAFMENPKYVNLAERTVGLTNIRNDTIAITGKKTIFASPTLYSLAMMSNHSGNKLYPSLVQCKNYQIDWVEGLMYLVEPVPFLQVVTTSSKDSLYISVVNRSATDTLSTSINFDTAFSPRPCMVYQLYSDHYLDMNSPENMENIKINEFASDFNGKYSFPPHSFTVIAMKYDGESSVVQPGNQTKIYPNPISNKVILEFPENEPLPNKIVIMDLMGKELIIINEIKALPRAINTDQLTNGFYMVNIHYADRIVSKKILKSDN
jgi:alpha-L-arabinofuranosidase